MLLQLHIADDIRAQGTSIVDESGTPKPRMELFGDGRAANLGSPFEHQGLEPGLGQVKGCYQTVVSAADDDEVASFRHESVFPRGSGSLTVFENLERCQASRGAHDSSARMRSRAAEVEILDRRAEGRVSRHRPKEE